MNAKIKSEIGAVVVSMLLVVGVLTFSLSSQLQSADAEKEKDKYDKLRESIRKKAEVTAGISDRGDRGDRGAIDIFSSNKNTTSEAIGIAGADGVNGTDAVGISGIGADGINGIGAEGINGIEGADNISNASATEGADGAKGTDAANGISNNARTDGGDE